MKRDKTDPLIDDPERIVLPRGVRCDGRKQDLFQAIDALPSRMKVGVAWLLTHYRVIRAITGSEPVNRKWLEEQIDELFRIREDRLALLAIYKLCRDSGAPTDPEEDSPA